MVQTRPIKPINAIGMNSSGKGVAIVPGANVSPRSPSTELHIMSVVNPEKTPESSGSAHAPVMANPKAHEKPTVWNPHRRNSSGRLATTTTMTVTMCDSAVIASSTAGSGPSGFCCRSP